MRDKVTFKAIGSMPGPPLAAPRSRHEFIDHPWRHGWQQLGQRRWSVQTRKCTGSNSAKISSIAALMRPFWGVLPRPGIYGKHGDVRWKADTALKPEAWILQRNCTKFWRPTTYRKLLHTKITMNYNTHLVFFQINDFEITPDRKNGISRWLAVFEHHRDQDPI